MLREVRITQPRHEPPRRWFVDDDFDVIVWRSAADEFVALQLCYDKSGLERASWAA